MLLQASSVPMGSCVKQSASVGIARGEIYPSGTSPPELVQRFEQADPIFAAIITEDPSVIICLQLRFGGEISRIYLCIDQLWQQVSALPPKAPLTKLELKDGVSCKKVQKELFTSSPVQSSGSLEPSGVG